MSFSVESMDETRGDCGENATDQQNKGANAAQQQAASLSSLVLSQTETLAVALCDTNLVLVLDSYAPRPSCIPCQASIASYRVFYLSIEFNDSIKSQCV
jgi:hypothetical protein